MVYFLLYLFLEVMISSSIAGSIGGFATFAEIILSAVVGLFILKNYNHTIGENLNQMKNGNISQEEFMKQNIFVALGAVLLIVPGFFTDILGILLQFQFFALIIARRVFKKNHNQTNSSNGAHSTNYAHFSTHFSHTNQSNQTNYKQKKGDEDVIDVEIIDDKPMLDK